MEFVKNDKGNNNIELKVILSPSDYSNELNKIFKDYQKKVNQPGFRSGKTPISVIKRMYGPALINEEIHKIVEKAVGDYIKDNNIDLLSTPIYNNEKSTQVIDDNTEKEFEFYYDLGLTPEFNLTLDKDLKIQYYKVNADDDFINKQIEDIRSRYGKYDEAEVIADNDIVSGEIVETDKNNLPKEGGVKTKTSLAVKYLADEKTKSIFIGKRLNETIVINPKEVFKNPEELRLFLNIKKEEIENISDYFSLTIESIKHIELAELNTELFNSIFPGENIETIEDFKAKLKFNIETKLAEESENKFYSDVNNHFLKTIEMDLPEEYLKQMAAITQYYEKQENKNSDVKFDVYYSEYLKGTKKNLIESKIIKDYSIDVKKEEIISYFESFVRSKTDYPGSKSTQEDVEKLIGHLLTKEEYIRNATTQIFTQKLLSLYKEKLEVEETSINYEEFIKLMNN